MATTTYVKTCLFGLAILLVLTALVNRVVDPFGYYRDISIEGFNAEKPQAHAYEREFKPIFLKQYKPEAVIFSNSYLEIGLDPTHPALTGNGAYRGYNFGITAANWEMVFCNVLYALDNTDLKIAIIGVQPGPMAKPDCAGQSKGMGEARPGNLLLSFAALKASYKTLAGQHRKPTQTREGMLFYHRGNADKIEQVFGFFLRQARSQYQDSQYQDKKCALSRYQGIPSWSYPLAKDKLDGLEYLLQRLAERQVQVKLVVYPYHALLLELAMACGHILDRWQALQAIAETVDAGNQANHAAAELWDFQGMAGFMTEKIRDNQVKYWQDTGHFNYEMGNAMLDTMFRQNTAPQDADGDEFGVLLTRDVVSERFHRFFKRRQAFIAANPWFAEELARFTGH